MMAVGLTDSVQIVAYIPKRLKARVVAYTKQRRRLSQSGLVEEAIEEFLQKVEKGSKPSHDGPAHHK